MDLRFSPIPNPADSSRKTYFSSTLAPIKFYLALHGFYFGGNKNKLIQNFLWIYRIIFLLSPTYILIRVAFYFPSVDVGFNLNFMILVIFEAFCLQSIAGTILSFIFTSTKQ